ncbi:MAG: hypothetical protein GXP31_14190 [Kiritimatiellaeota bacterium]|nr:hypothetical protein [Kiritimatiellota bacterium]
MTPGETVVLVHGLGRTRASMLVLSKRLQTAGYKTMNFPYNQARSSLDELSDRLADFIRENVTTSKYHLIGHSLGNIIIRNAFRNGFPPGLGRIVMLAPPNRPAHLARKLRQNLLYRWLAGESGQKLSDEEFYRNLPAPTVEFGVIAGDKGQSLTFSEPNDGVVKVEATKLEGMADFIVLHHTHTFMMNSKDTFENCVRFLKNGRFR